MLEFRSNFGILNEIPFRKLRKNELPPDYFEAFVSENKPNGLTPYWVTARFAPDPIIESYFVCGTEHGSILIVSIEAGIKEELFTEQGCILDVNFVPCIPNRLLSIAGHSKVTSWDMLCKKLVRAYEGHQGSVRSLVAFKENPYLFATGSRDGLVLIWDQRAGQLNSAVSFVKELKDCHSTTIGRGKKYTRGITSLVSFTENKIISSSTSFDSGIRIWDLRSVRHSTPCRIFQKPSGMAERDYGIMSLCADRYSASLYAASTDSLIYEYSLTSTKDFPTNFFKGGKKALNNAYSTRLDVSPISDHLLFGGSTGTARLWDLKAPKPKTGSGVYPICSFGGHCSNEVLIGTFSCQCNYILTMDELSHRFWIRKPEFSAYFSELNSKNLENYTSVYPSRAAKVEKMLDGLFKITSRTSIDGNKREPLSTRENNSGVSSTKPIPLPNCPFSYKYPTMNLPVFAQNIQVAVQPDSQEQVSKPALKKRRLQDWFPKIDQGTSSMEDERDHYVSEVSNENAKRKLRKSSSRKTLDFFFKKD